MIVTIWPAIVSVPVRAAPELAAAVYDTEPSPVPDAPRVIEIQDAFDVAVHAQPLSVPTSTEPVPPDGLTDCVVADKVKWHAVGGGGAGGVGVGDGGGGVGVGGVISAC